MKTKELELLIKDGNGVLPNQAIDCLKELSFIQNSDIAPGPASLDITLSDECYEVDFVMLPKKNQTVYDLIKDSMNGKSVRTNVLVPGKNYLIAHKERFNLPHSLYGYANPKSTTGRNFVHTRLISDFVEMYDHLPRGHKGKIWSLVTPKIWPISFVPGKDALNQIRIFIKDSRLSEMELMSLQQKMSVMKSSKGEKVDYSRSFIRGGDHGYMIFTIDCRAGHTVGYVAKESNKPVPIGKSRKCKAGDYFEPISGNGYLQLLPGKFYILSSLERVSMPNDFAAEVRAIDERFGEFRSHLAGFFDPGFGNHEFGNNITLEVYAQEKMCFQDGQPVCSLHFEKMARLPEKLYSEVSGNYKLQEGPKLARNFY